MQSDCRLIVLAYIEENGQVLITRRPEGVTQGGRWEFPGGKVNDGERFSEALSRELMEEIDISVTIGQELASTRYHYPEGCVELHLFHCSRIIGTPKPREVTDIRWIPTDQLDTVPFPPANALLLAACEDCSE